MNDMTFELFLSMEFELTQQMKLTESEDILFLWSLISVSWGSEYSTVLLKI